MKSTPEELAALRNMIGGGNATYQLPNNGGSYSANANSTPMLPGAQPLPEVQAPNPLQPTINTNPMTAVDAQQPQALPQAEPDPTPEELAASLNSSIYGISDNQVPDANEVATMTPYDKYNMLRRKRGEERNAGTGLYALDKTMAYSPDQIRQIYNSADDVYGKQMDELATEIQTSSRPEMSAGQQSAFNSIVAQKNKSPLLAAADRLPVLKNSIDKARENPDNGSLQLNLVYSYVQALDTYQSAVREGELSLVNSIDSKVGQLSNYVSQIQNGQIVRPEVINQMADAADNLVNTINSSAKSKAKSFKAQADAQGLGEVWDRYESGYDKSYDSESKPQASKDQAALDAGYTQEEIDAYKKSKGLDKQSFNSVGNTTASIDIPRSSRLSYNNNNPGNLRFAGQEGAVKGEGGFAKFPSPEVGVKALNRQIALDASRGHSLESFINKFAPPTENNTKQYIAQAVKTLGYPANTPIADIPQDALTRFIALKESSTKIS